MVQYPMLSKGKHMPGIIHPYTSKTEKPTVPIKKNYWGDTHPIFYLWERSELSVVALTQQVTQLLIPVAGLATQMTTPCSSFLFKK